MEKNVEYGPFSPYEMNFDPKFNDIYSKDPMLNPMLQYEQAYMYYRYLTSQMEYKIKCKEFELLSKKVKKDL